MTEEERKALVEHLRDYADSVADMWNAADQIEADGQRIAELEAALHSAIRNIEVLIGDMEAHKECVECQSGIPAKYEAVAEYRAALGDKG